MGGLTLENRNHLAKFAQALPQLSFQTTMHYLQYSRVSVEIILLCSVAIQKSRPLLSVAINVLVAKVHAVFITPIYYYSKYSVTNIIYNNIFYLLY